MQAPRHGLQLTAGCLSLPRKYKRPVHAVYGMPLSVVGTFVLSLSDAGQSLKCSEQLIMHHRSKMCGCDPRGKPKRHPSHHCHVMWRVCFDEAEEIGEWRLHGPSYKIGAAR
jgi:hypothetical protein